MVIPQSHDKPLEGAKPFEFHPIERRNKDDDLFEFDIQYIAVEGSYYGKLYINNDFVMFKSKFDVVDENIYPFSLVVRILTFYFQS